MSKSLFSLLLFLCSVKAYSFNSATIDSVDISVIKLDSSNCLICVAQDKFSNNPYYNARQADKVDSEKNEVKFENIFTQPKFLITSAVVATGLFATDDFTYHRLHNFKMKHRFVKEFSPVITNLGEGQFSLALFGSFFLHYALFDSPKSLQTAKIGVESFLLSGIGVQIAKQLFGRERPSNATQSGGRFHGPFSFFSKRTNDIASYDSFPSGHTITAFATASTLAEMYPDSFIPYASYGIATIVALSRITESAHWASDCFVGALMGIFSTKVVIYLNQKYSSGSLSPVVSNKYLGAQYSLNF
jgi:membrane-associated phospholipid phosphatase